LLGQQTRNSTITPSGCFHPHPLSTFLQLRISAVTVVPKTKEKKKTIAAANFLHLLNDNPSIPIFDTENICSHNMVDIEPLTKRTRSVQQL